MERQTKQQASDFVLGSELARLGVFERNHIAPVATAEMQDARIELLDVGGLRDRKENPRHRPAGVDAPVKADKIVQAVLFERATNPKKQRKKIVGEVGDYYGVDRSYVYECLRQVTPERRKQMVQSIIVSCFWPEMMAHLQILVAKAAPPQS